MRKAETLPAPVFPQYPELFHDLDEQDLAAHEAVVRTGKRHWPASKVMKTMRGWMFPYFKSRLLPGDFQPIIAYLFTEWKCNLDCHYCWSYDNRVKGMTEDTARVPSTGCTPHLAACCAYRRRATVASRFRPQGRVLRSKKRFLVYLATNARLLRPEVTDRLADAGMPPSILPSIP